LQLKHKNHQDEKRIIDGTMGMFAEHLAGTLSEEQRPAPRHLVAGGGGKA
jgi:hypothetical protein